MSLNPPPCAVVMSYLFRSGEINDIWQSRGAGQKVNLRDLPLVCQFYVHCGLHTVEHKAAALFVPGPVSKRIRGCRQLDDSSLDATFVSCNRAYHSCWFSQGQIPLEIGVVN